MEKIYIKTWLGIDLLNLPIVITPYKLADTEFYTLFFRNFYKQVKRFEDIDDITYLDYKEEVIDHLVKLTTVNNKLLSIGCGLGYIELRLSEINKTLDITAIEPGTQSQWLLEADIKLLQGFFPEVLEGKAKDFDIVYASSIDYVFDDLAYENFFRSVIDFGIDEILVTEIFLARKDFVSRIKLIVKEALIFLGLYNPGQFWGYLRTLEEHKSLMERAGFSSFTTGQYKHGSFWIRANK